MIVKLKCLDNGGNTDITPKKVYAGLIDINGVYVIRNDMGYFTFVDTNDQYGAKWEVVN